MDIPLHVSEFIRDALKEDIGRGDVTTGATVPPGLQGEAVILAKSPLVVAGLPFAAMAFMGLDHALSFEPVATEGEGRGRREVLARVSGRVDSILKAERVALNLIQHLSGIATLTAKYVEMVKGTGARILDTRKTMPGMRYLEKYAVRMGGGMNHRMGLDDGFLIKDNHIAAAGGIVGAVRACRDAHPLLKVEVECENMDQVGEALKAGADIIMLDNMKPPEVSAAVRLIKGRARAEASGNITIRNVREYALAGVDYISVGSLTHSAPAADISLRLA